MQEDEYAARRYQGKESRVYLDHFRYFSFLWLGIVELCKTHEEACKEYGWT